MEDLILSKPESSFCTELGSVARLVSIEFRGDLCVMRLPQWSDYIQRTTAHAYIYKPSGTTPLSLGGIALFPFYFIFLLFASSSPFKKGSRHGTVATMGHPFPRFSPTAPLSLSIQQTNPPGKRNNAKGAPRHLAPTDRDFIRRKKHGVVPMKRRAAPMHAECATTSSIKASLSTVFHISSQLIGHTFSCQLLFRSFMPQRARNICSALSVGIDG